MMPSSRFLAMRIHILGASSPLGVAFSQVCRARELDHTCYSRRAPLEMGTIGDWRQLDLSADNALTHLSISSSDVLVCVAPLAMLANACGRATSLLPPRVIALSSASAKTKAESPWPADRAQSQHLRESESALVRQLGSRLVILRPTMIYGSGRDRNVARIAQFLRRFHLFPFVGSGRGLRAPVHADALASVIENLIVQGVAGPAVLNVPCGEVRDYRAMVKRIADSTGAWLAPFLKPWMPRRAIGVLACGLAGMAEAAAAASRMAEDLPVSDYATVLGVCRWSVRPDRRAIGLDLERFP